MLPGSKSSVLSDYMLQTGFVYLNCLALSAGASEAQRPPGCQGSNSSSASSGITVTSDNIEAVQ